MLTSMVDPMRFVGADIVDLYGHRWEIELGYREMKHSLQQHRLTLRSKKAAGIRQELWGVLLAYNLLRSQMVKMAASLKGYTASQLSFHMASVYLIHELSCMPYLSRGASRSGWQSWRNRRGSLYYRSEGSELPPQCEGKTAKVCGAKSQ